MADLLDKLHMDAGLDLLRADASVVTYPSPEGLVPTTPAEEYVLVYTTIERPADAVGNSLAGLSQMWTVRWICHCVGPNEYSALAIGMRVRAALLDKRPTIAGRSCGLIREEQSLPPTKDDTTGRVVLDAVSVYRLSTT